MAAVCEIRRGLRRCGRAAVELCQYCGQRFCDEHKHFVGGFDAVCSRKRCRTKKDEMDQHLAYREGVERRNRVGLCGEEGCGPHPKDECSLCLGLFCSEHVRAKVYPFWDDGRRVMRPASVCAHCYARRKLWGRS